ncbi:MAG: hypothetical protein WCO79_00205 [bacterium]
MRFQIKQKVLRYIPALLVFSLLFVTSVSPAPVDAQVIPFGGPVLYLEPPGVCLGGERFIIGPPGPPSLTTYYFVTYVSVPFAVGPLISEGQFILGEASGYMNCYFYCGTHICVTYGGPIVLFYGTSL